MTDRPFPDAAEIDPASARQGRLSELRRLAPVLAAILAFLLFRAITADDGTHGVAAGDCIAAIGSDEVTKVDCGDRGSLGIVTFVQKNAPTDQSSALRICSRHDAQRAFTTATSDGGIGTVICVTKPT